MSVINDMLRDLDRRHGKQPAFEVGTVAVVAPTREMPWRFFIIALAIAAVVAGSYNVIAPRLHTVVGSTVMGSTQVAPEKVVPANFASAQENPSAREIAPANKMENIAPAARAVVVDAVATTPVAENPVPPKIVGRVTPETAEQKTSAPKMQSQEPALALTVAEPVRKQLSQNPEALAEESYRQGMLAMRSGSRVDAEREFNNALSLQAQHTATIAALARLYVEDARLDAAEKLLTPALSANPDALDLRQLQARVLLQSGHAEQALQALRARQPDLQLHSDYYAMLAAIEQQLGDHRAAAEHYRALLNIDATQAAYWLGLALALDNLQQSREAVEAYRRATALNNLPAAARDFAQQRVLALEK